MIGLPVFLGAATTPHAAFCQVSGTAAKPSARDLRHALSHDTVLHNALTRFTQATMVQIAQSQMLGVRRPTASDTARHLQAQGLIRCQRGTITITDPLDLKKAACSCYDIVKAEFDLINTFLPGTPDR